MFYSVSWFNEEKHDRLNLFSGKFRQDLLNCKNKMCKIDLFCVCLFELYIYFQCYRLLMG